MGWGFDEEIPRWEGRIAYDKHRPSSRTSACQSVKKKKIGQ